MNTVTSVREQLEAQRRRAQGIGIAHAGVYLAAVVLVALRLYVPAAVAAGVNLLVFLFFVRGQIKGYSQAVARANVLCGLCAPLEEARFTGRAGLSAEQFRSLALLPIMEGDNSLLVRAAFSGRGFGLELGGCEMTLHYPAPGAKNTRYRFLSGTLLTAAPRSKTWAGDWLLLRRGLLDEAVQRAFLEERGYTPAVCPESRVSGRFQLYAGDGAREMPRWLARRLSRTLEKAECLGAVRLTADRAAVYLENRFYTGGAKVRDLPDEAWLTHCPLPERDGVWELFESLGAAQE